MKTLLITIGLALSYTASAQWIYKTVDNGFDAPYKIAHTNDYQNQFLNLILNFQYLKAPFLSILIKICRFASTNQLLYKFSK